VNDNAVFQTVRGAAIASKLRSYRSARPPLPL